MRYVVLVDIGRRWVRPDVERGQCGQAALPLLPHGGFGAVTRCHKCEAVLDDEDARWCEIPDPDADPRDSYEGGWPGSPDLIEVPFCPGCAPRPWWARLWAWLRRLAKRTP